MSTATWTDTSDFESATASVEIYDGTVRLRHQGGYYSGFESGVGYPTTLGTYGNGWDFNKDGTTGNPTATLSSDKLQLVMNTENNAAKVQWYLRDLNSQISKDSVFSASCKFQITAGDGYAVMLGFFPTTFNTTPFANSIVFAIDSDGTAYLVAYDSGGTSDLDSAEGVTIGADHDIVVTLAGNGTSLTAKVVHDGGTENLSIALTEISGTITTDYFGFVNNSAVDGKTQTWLIEYVDCNVCTWTPFHQGCADGHRFNAVDFSDASAETKSGWTFTNSGGATNSVAFSSGKLVLTLKRENSDTKKGHYWRATNASIAKNSTFDEIFQVNLNDVTNHGGNFGFYNSTNDNFKANSIWVSFESAHINLYAWDSVSGVDYDAGTATHTVSTDYWVRLKGNGTAITAASYTSLANCQNETDAVDSLSVAVTDISGTITCDRIGFHNCNLAGGSITQIITVGMVDGDSATWYPACTAKTTDYAYSAPAQQQTSWDTFAVTVTGTVNYYIRTKSSATASFTDSSITYTAAEIQALEDTDEYGVGFKFVLDPSVATTTIAFVSIEHEDDTVAPGNITSQYAEPTSTDTIWVGWTDAIDTGGSGLAKNQMRVSIDGESSWLYIGYDTANHQLSTTSASGTLCAFLNPNTTATANVYDYVVGVDRSDLSLGSGSVTIQMRGVDGAGNVGGWVSATEISLGGGSGSATIVVADNFNFGPYWRT